MIAFIRRASFWLYVRSGLEHSLSLQSDVALCDAVHVFTILRHLSLSSAALTTASCSVIPVELLISSVASFLVLGGGGGQDPQMYRQKKVTYLRERAPIFRSQNKSAYIITINAVITFITYGMAP